jgi:hypothetical protein
MQLFTPNAFSAEKVEILDYDICKKNVENVQVVNRDNNYFVRIKLSDKASKAFADITGENINKRLRISVGFYLIVNRIIPSRVESGMIESLAMTEQHALNVQQMILNDTGLRCGLMEVAIQGNIWKPHLKKYLQDKYPRVDEVIAQSIVRTKNGTKGSLTIRGEIEPMITPKGITIEERVVEIVKDLFMREKELFGFTSEDEFRVDKVDFNYIDKNKYPNGRSDYMFKVMRFVGDARVNAYFIVHVSENEKINYITGNMERVSPEVYDLALQPMIDKEKAAAIIIADSEKTDKVTMANKIQDLEKMIINEDPFIIWTGKYNGFVYQIDAFSGTLLRKVPRHKAVDAC